MKIKIIKECTIDRPIKEGEIVDYPKELALKLIERGYAEKSIINKNKTKK